MSLNEYLDNNKQEIIRVDDGQLIVAESARKQLIDFELKRKEIEKKEKELKAKLEEVMRANNITGYETNDKRIRISLGEDTTIETIDKDKLFMEFPDAYRECLKETPRKGVLRITIRGDEDGI